MRGLRACLGWAAGVWLFRRRTVPASPRDDGPSNILAFRARQDRPLASPDFVPTEALVIPFPGRAAALRPDAEPPALAG